MEPSPIYSIISSANEVWVGGEGIILYYNEKKNFGKHWIKEEVYQMGLFGICVSQIDIFGLQLLEVSIE